MSAKDELLAKVSEATNRLHADLAAGHSQRLTDYLAFLGRFHRYSFGNTMLIYFTMPTATHVAGYHRWRELGRQVRKGEHGIAILAPCMRKVAEDEDSDESPAKRKVMGFRTAFVFDISQTDSIDGAEVPTIGDTTGEVGDWIGRLECHIHGLGIELAYCQLGAANGRSFGGRIEIADGLDEPVRLRVLAHELAHELLHGPAERLGLPKAVRELEAESVAFVVTQAAGLTNERSPDYIGLQGGTAEMLTASLERVRKTAADILSALAEVEAVAA